MYSTYFLQLLVTSSYCSAQIGEEERTPEAEVFEIASRQILSDVLVPVPQALPALAFSCARRSHP